MISLKCMPEVQGHINALAFDSNSPQACVFTSGQPSDFGHTF